MRGGAEFMRRGAFPSEAGNVLEGKRERERERETRKNEKIFLSAKFSPKIFRRIKEKMEIAKAYFFELLSFQFNYCLSILMKYLVD